MTRDEIRLRNESIQRAYHVTFASADGKTTLADLIAYCHGRRSTFDSDARVHAFNEGKRDVLCRILEFLNLNIEEIYSLRHPAPATSSED